jgi:hypothetical protein
MKLLEEVLLISLQFGYQPLFGLEQFWGQWPLCEWGASITCIETPSYPQSNVLSPKYEAFCCIQDTPPAGVRADSRRQGASRPFDATQAPGRFHRNAGNTIKH